MRSNVDWLPVDWLKHEVTFVQVNVGPTPVDAEFRESFLHGLHGFAPWEKMKGKMRSGDRLFVFSSPWGMLAGSMGIALVRGTTIIDGVTVVQS
jgi:hypothetical protein